MFKRLFLLSITVLLSSCATSTKEPVVKSKTEAISKEEEKGIKVLQDHLDKGEHDLFFLVYNDTYNELKSEESKKKAKGIYISTIESFVTDKDTTNIYAYMTNPYNEPYHLDWLKEDVQNEVNNIVIEEEERLASDAKKDTIDKLFKRIDDKTYFSLTSYEDDFETIPNLRSIIYYGLALKSIDDGENAEVTADLLSYIDPRYDGERSEEMKKLVNQYLSNEEWERKYSNYIEMEEFSAEYDKKPLPTIGMTAAEVRNSKWGEPIKVNRTTTATSVSEQWVYRDYKYLYFENGILTTIQD